MPIDGKNLGSKNNLRRPRPEAISGRPFLLDRVSAVILQLLAEGNVILRAIEICAIAEVSRETAKRPLARMLDAGLIVQPNGERGGYAITEQGIKRIEKLPVLFRQLWKLAV